MSTIDEIQMSEQNISLTGFNLMRFKWLKVAVFHMIIFSLITIIFGAFSLGWNNWQTITIDQNLPKDKVAISQLSRNLGLFYICVNDENLGSLHRDNETVYRNGCIHRDIGQFYREGIVDRNYFQVIKLRLAQICLHTGGLLLFVILSAIGFGAICVWFKATEDTEFYRKYRLLIGLGYGLCGYALLISILLWHIGQDNEKRLPTKYLPYEFPHWTDEVKSHVRIRLDIGYAFIWVATICAFIASWIMLFSTCCFTEPEFGHTPSCRSIGDNFHDNIAFENHMENLHLPKLPRYSQRDH